MATKQGARRCSGVADCNRVSDPSPDRRHTDPWHSPPPDPERARVLQMLRKHGHGPTSFQVLERGFSYWFDEDAVVGYVDAAGWRVVAGCPVAAPAQWSSVAERFIEDAGRPVAFLGVEDDFLEALRGSGVTCDALKIAEQPDLDPRNYSVDGQARRSLRSQLNRARNKGVRVRRVQPEALQRAPGSLRAEIERVLERWLESRRMSVLRFMVDLQPFTFPEERRYFVAEQGDQPVGFLSSVPVYGREGWFLEDLVRVPDAPNGTSELLVNAALEEARAEGCGYVTFGIAPLAGIERGPGPHRWIRQALGVCYDHLGLLYPFAGLRAFKANTTNGWRGITTYSESNWRRKTRMARK